MRLRCSRWPCTWRTFLPSTIGSFRLAQRMSFCASCTSRETLLSEERPSAVFQHRKISSLSTELLELHSEKPAIHILLIPGNPGVVSFYKDFIEGVYTNLEGIASVSAIGHVSHSKNDCENGRIFSLEDQINHKVAFIKEEFQDIDIPLIMVGHSIGSYICLEVFKRLEKQVNFTIGLYPFLALNPKSFKQSLIGSIARTHFLSNAVSAFVSLLGLCPARIKNALAEIFLGPLSSAEAINATCSYLLKYHTIRNILFMAKTEFEELSANPDWAFVGRKQHQIAFLFGIDDHWGPLSHCEEISQKAPDVALSIERDGHSHAFCCTEAGSAWVASYVVSIIKKSHRI